VSRAFVHAYATIWASTAIGALAGAVGLHPLAVPPPYDALAATPATALTLFAGNAVITLWPLALVALRWQSIIGAARLADGAIRAQLLGNGMIVGNALAQHPRLALYLPHLPLEWAAISLPAAAWSVARHDEAPRLHIATATTVAALAATALIETYVVPIS
jgi:hypothetical protein